MQLSIEQRLRALEDAGEIARLKASYCTAVDCGWNGRGQDGDRLAALFVSDGVWDAGAVARLEGREAIRAFFNANPFPFGFHLTNNPVIKVDGDRATGQWQLFCPGTDGNGQAVWIGGTYDDEFVRTPEGWRFRRLTASVAFTSHNVQGWELAGRKL